MKYSDVKFIIVESIIHSLNEDGVIMEDDHEYEYKQGIKWGIKHHTDLRGRPFNDEELKSYPRSFVKGYKQTMYGSLWDRFNSKMTDFLGRMGSSRVREIEEPSDPNLYHRPDYPKHRAPYTGFTYDYGKKVYPPDRKLKPQPKSSPKKPNKEIQSDLGI